ncbi:lasso RiPP family leader peptide-containing protein [Streptomyces sp. NPDC003077]|uniref:lasso RiPP family leader peptide-containing protein n=1 Tax=Streptomyces sp. NPDC003077 TaxID=3154443 RepID=UPI0033A86E2C
MHDATKMGLRAEAVLPAEGAGYESPVLVEAGAFAEDTRGSTGSYSEGFVGRFL